jgi:hypothetical protein
VHSEEASVSEERRDYAVLTSLSTREEAEVAAAALRAGGIDAIVGNAETANMHWGLVQAMGGLQILVPSVSLAEARRFLRDRLKSVSESEDDDYDPSKRKDRWKAWVLLVWILGPMAVLVLLVLGARLLQLAGAVLG